MLDVIFAFQNKKFLLLDALMQSVCSVTYIALAILNGSLFATRMSTYITFGAVLFFASSIWIVEIVRIYKVMSLKSNIILSIIYFVVLVGGTVGFLACMSWWA